MGLGAGCSDGFADPSREFASDVPGRDPYPTVIELPSTLGVVDTTVTDVHGTPIGVDCATCHGPDPEQSWAATPGEPFHTKVGTTEPGTEARVLDRHGRLPCNSCHDTDRTRLHKADGSLLEFGESIELCAQCHGPQYRDYVHGSHGGMNGYWDLRQGPRTRNHCVVCHAAHTPAYEPVMPVHPPRDRYLEVSQ